MAMTVVAVVVMTAAGVTVPDGVLVTPRLCLG